MVLNRELFLFCKSMMMRNSREAIEAFCSKQVYTLFSESITSLNNSHTISSTLVVA